MVSRMIANAGKNEKTALLKNSSEKDEKRENVSPQKAFKSLLNSLQGNTSSFAGGQEVETNQRSEEGSVSLSNATGPQSDILAGNISRILSGSDLQDEDLEAEVKQVLNQFSQPGRGRIPQNKEARQMEEEGPLHQSEKSPKEDLKDKLTDLLEKLQATLPTLSKDEGMLTDRLSEEEVDRLTEALASGQAEEATDMLSQISENIELENEDFRTQLKGLFNQLKEEGGQPEMLQSQGAGALAPNTGDGDVQNEASNKPLTETETAEKEVIESESQNKTKDKKEEPLIVNNKEDEKEIISRNKSVGALSEKRSKKRSLLSRLEQVLSTTKNSSPEASAETEEKTVASRENTNGIEITDKQKKLIDSFFLKSTLEGDAEKALEMKSAKVDKTRKKESRNLHKGFSTSADSNRRTFLGLSTISDAAKPDNNVSLTGMADGATEAPGNIDFSADEQEVLWKEHTAESDEIKNEQEASQQKTPSSSLKLGQIPVANGSLRKRILPGLTKNILKAASEAKKNPEIWQKHNFVLDDGKNIQLSVREVKGVLQVKMGSMNLDLSKLLQQNLQQIREHLKQEFGSEVDLQFENHGQDDPSSDFSGDSSSPHRRKGSHFGTGDSEAGFEGAGKVKLKAVRNFGYNQMEWTA